MTLKFKVAFAVPDSLRHELRERVIKDGYGLRGKSIWVSEAIENLFNLKDFLSLVNYSDGMQGFPKIETVVINYQLKLRLDEAVIQVRRQFPLMEGVKSRIMRTAILQRIIRS